MATNMLLVAELRFLPKYLFIFKQKKPHAYKQNIQK